MKRLISISMSWMVVLTAFAQKFNLEQVNDSLYSLTLTGDSIYDEWLIRYPVYRFCVADINGDGMEEAMVGVVKSTRYFHEVGRRLFIYKNQNGKINRMWMGSRVGGKIVDFTVVDGMIVCMSEMNDGNFSVSKLKTARFGLEFVEFLTDGIDEQTASLLFKSFLDKPLE